MKRIKKLISFVSPCYNESANVKELYTQITNIMNIYKNKFSYEIIFIDNASTDNTVHILKKIALNDKKVKIIVNTRNFGHLKSPYYALLQASGDAVILMASDLEDPPELIPQFIKLWEQGYKVVKAIKESSEESKIMFFLRKCFYRFINKISEINLTINYYGYGLYDKQIIEILKTINEPYPYFRGLIDSLGFESAIIKFKKPKRKKGKSKNNLYTLYDTAMLGITNYSRLPLRLATIMGIFFAVISFFVALGYGIYKILFWSRFQLGLAPIIIGLFFFSSIQLFFIGVIGEYIGTIFLHVKKMPLVIEKERINFESKSENYEKKKDKKKS